MIKIFLLTFLCIALLSCVYIFAIDYQITLECTDVLRTVIFDTMYIQLIFVFIISVTITFFVFSKKREQKKFQEFAATIPVSGIIFDEHTGKLVMANNAAMSILRIPEGEKIGDLTVFDFLSLPEDKEKILGALNNKVNISDKEVMIIARDGKSFWAMISLCNMIFGGKQRIALTLMDLSGRKQIEHELKNNAINLSKQVEARTTELKEQALLLENSIKELEEAKRLAEDANASKGQFLANMSHELRTPLNAIIGYSEIIKNQANTDNNERLAEDMNKIFLAGKHLLGLINDILDFSKIEAGKMDFFIEKFSIDELILGVEAMVKPLATKRNNKFEVVNGLQGESMMSDLTKVRQNILNLIGNAAKFTENGRIILEFSKEERDRTCVLIKIRDTGVGISKDQIGKLFKAFSQADASTTRKFGGTGLGLAITKSFCKLLGGEIIVESEEGKGTCFSMILPQDSSYLKS